jgi:pimeloyl-ACP methyl ester carboxylesterase
VAVEVPEVRYAVAGELSLAYFDLEGGPHTVVVMPGLISHLDAMFDLLPGWQPFIARLNGFARVIAFDKRGCGMSDRILGAPPLEDRTADLGIVMDDVGVETATIVGVSEGGSIATAFAASFPERVSSLVLCDAFAKFTRSDDYPWGIGPEEVEFLLGEYCDGWGTGVTQARYMGGDLDPVDQARWGRFERQICTPTEPPWVCWRLRGLVSHRRLWRLRAFYHQNWCSIGGSVRTRRVGYHRSGCGAAAR